MNQNIALTGSTGYLGGLIANSLKQKGFKLHLVNRGTTVTSMPLDEALPFIDASLPANKLQEIFSELDINCVVHAATHFTRSRDSSIIPQVVGANFDFSVNVFEAAKSSGARFVNFNSPWQDTVSKEGAGPYAATKEAFRRYVEVAKSNSLLVDNLYIPETFGPNDPRDKVIANLIKSRTSGEPFELKNSSAKINLSYAPFLADFVADLVSTNAPESKICLYANFQEVPLLLIQETLDRISKGSRPAESEFAPVWYGNSAEVTKTNKLFVEGGMPDSFLFELLEYSFFKESLL